MQLEKQVAFHKTMGDPTRIKIVHLLAAGSLHVNAIAGKLGLTAPTISHHLSKLKDCNLVYSRRDKNTMYYFLNSKVLAHHASVLERFTDQGGGTAEMNDKMLKEKQKVMNNFMEKSGRLKSIPAQQKKKLFLLEHMVEGLKVGTKYTEKEINEYIKDFHADFATLRREFIIHQFMFRENGIYEVNPREMWGSTALYKGE
ncbi:metalloregulator ArsR/SmtB family transcription factor [Rossellomorea aquimaris]|uniref:ArsR family transcriptional regulator n=1 Tax=Rossellomorea aquimaris TaxID=189382 RepID=A0A1J6W484_9BACI|nr:metalloregulator ArsR/SmtB family transcription factor [Rossellomorea aquimaris]OIU72437.1 ArsR family transcriptional regulator [Rossellomorea aquimaris]